MELKIHLLFLINVFQKMLILFLFIMCTNLGKRGKQKKYSLARYSCIFWLILVTLFVFKKQFISSMTFFSLKIPHIYVIVRMSRIMFKACKLAGRLLIHTQIRNLQSPIISKKPTYYFKLENVINIQNWPRWP